MAEPTHINLREIERLPVHGGEGIPYVAITPAERDALVAAVRAAKRYLAEIAPEDRTTEDDMLAEVLDRIADEEPTDV